MQVVRVDEQYQSGYSYTLNEPTGQNFSPDFKPQLTPEQMFGLGIFGGDYFNEPPREFPANWFNGVTLVPKGMGADKSLNYFKVNASQSLAEWQRKGWINPEDPKGWVLWYCRYYMGRRIPEEDARQIKRWRNMQRHVTQVERYCRHGDVTCRPRQRQALLHWAYDSRKL